MWRNICNNLSRYSFWSEKEYQNEIVRILSYALGWNLKEEIVEQPTLPLGSTERLIPDIVIKKEGKPQFIIEVKEPRHQQQLRNIQQLESYLKQLEVNFGLYFGEKIELYYKEFGEGKPAIRVLSINFNEEDPNGDKFVELFSRETFDTDKLLAFCKEEIKNQEILEEQDKYVQYLCSSEGKQLISNLLSVYFKGKEKPDAWIQEVLGKINISISKVYTESKPLIIEHHCKQTHTKIKNNQTRKRNKNSKGYNAFIVMRKILEKYSDRPYEELLALFDNKDNYILDVTKIKDEKRWFLNDDEVMKSCDDVEYAISNQWGTSGNCVPKMNLLISLAQEVSVEVPECLYPE